MPEFKRVMDLNWDKFMELLEFSDYGSGYKLSSEWEGKKDDF